MRRFWPWQSTLGVPRGMMCVLCLKLVVWLSHDYAHRSDWVRRAYSVNLSFLDFLTLTFDLGIDKVWPRVILGILRSSLRLGHDLLYRWPVESASGVMIRSATFQTVRWVSSLYLWVEGTNADPFSYVSWYIGCCNDVVIGYIYMIICLLAVCSSVAYVDIIRLGLGNTTLCGSQQSWEQARHKL